MAILLTTISSITINDLGGRSFVHPVVDYDLTDEFSYDEVRNSFNLGLELDAGNVTLVNDGVNVNDSNELKFVQPKVSTSTETFNSPVTFNNGIVFGPGIEANINSNTNDLTVPNLSGGVTLCLNFTGQYKLTGIAVPDPTKSFLLFVKNTGNSGILRNNDSGSIAQNRFLIPSGNSNFGNKSAILVYDTIAQRWQIYGL